MKKIYSTIMVLAMMVAALGFTACGGDDDDVPPTTSIVGVWVCTHSDYGEWEELMEGNVKPGDILRMNADKTYSINGNDNENGTYSMNGNTLVFTSDGMSSEWTIKNLSSDNLTIVQKEIGATLSFSKK